SEIQSGLEKFRARTGLQVVPVSDYEFRCYGTKLNITMGIPAYTAANMSTRGGLVQVKELNHYQRTSVCFSPLHSVTVDYSGECVLCCQVRADSLLYRDLAAARRGLLAPGPKLGVCKTCTISDTGPDRLARNPTVSAFATHIPGFHSVFGALMKRASRIRKYEEP